MTDADIRKLEQAAEVFQTSTAEGDLVKMAEADVNFHEVIYEAADNKRLMQVLKNSSRADLQISCRISERG